MSERELSRRAFLSVSGAALGGAALAGYSGKAFASSPRGLRASTSVTTINVWSGIDLTGGGSAMTRAFNDSHKTLKVNYTWFPNTPEGNTKLDSALASGNAVDVYFSYGLPYFQPRIASGAALPLASYIASDKAISAWVKEESKSMFTSGGKFYGLATVFQPNFIWANEAILRKQKVHIDSGWKFADFLAAVRKLSYGSGSSRVYGTYESLDLAGMKLGGNEWYTHKDGKLTTNFANPLFRTSWSTWRSLIEENASYPWTDVLAESATVFSQDLFVREQFALWPGATWEAIYLNNPSGYPHNFKVTCFPYPTYGNGPTYNTGSYANYICIHPSGKQDAAWEFVSWFMTNGCQYYLNDVPAMPDVETEGQIVNRILGPQASKYFDVEAWKAVALDRSVVMPPQTIDQSASKINTIMTDNLNLYLTGHMSLDTMVSKTQSQASAAL